MVAGIRRSRHGPPDRKEPADADIVSQLLAAIVGDGLVARRDRALIAFGMALAARRSELVALDVADLAWEEQGLRVTIRRSKTDQEGDGAVVAMPEGRRLTPSPHLRAWLDAAKITEGPLFRPLWKGGRVRAARLSGHVVILSELSISSWWKAAIHTGHTKRLRTQILRHGGSNISVLIIPWQLEQVETARVMENEEPRTAEDVVAINLQ